MIAWLRRNAFTCLGLPPLAMMVGAVTGQAFGPHWGLAFVGIMVVGAICGAGATIAQSIESASRLRDRH